VTVLLNRHNRRGIELRVRKIEKIETALERNFQQLSINAGGWGSAAEKGERAARRTR
jgi:uncharacterized 2Fe-2S/4Fe-4S cluster protein (DUF4445 family)